MTEITTAQIHLRSTFDAASPRMRTNRNALLELLATLRAEEETLRLGGGAKAAEAQHAKGRLTVRERLKLLLDEDTHFLELGLWAAYGMYSEYGGAPGAGVITGIGRVSGRLCMIIANDATVKAGAFFPMTAKKVLRAQTIALENRIPTLYLVDSAGVFLPLQEDVFPDTDDFGRVFRNNAIMSSVGIPQITAIMGMCVAGGAYLPVMTDHGLMTELPAHAVHRALGCGAFLTALRRTASGEFDENQSHTLAALEELANRGALVDALIPATEVLPEIPNAIVDALTAGQIRHGKDFRLSPFVARADSKYVKAVTPEGDLIAIGEARLPNLYHPVLVL